MLDGSNSIFLAGSQSAKFVTTLEFNSKLVCAMLYQSDEGRKAPFILVINLQVTIMLILV